MYEKLKCPLIGKKCITKECTFWMQMTIKNIQTQQLEDGSGCAIVKNVEINLEALKKTVGIQEAVESSRNETVLRQDAFLALMNRGQLASR